MGTAFHKISEAKRERGLELLGQGLTIAVVAIRLGLPSRTVGGWAVKWRKEGRLRETRAGRRPGL